MTEFWQNYTQQAAPSSLRLILGEALREGGFGDIKTGSGFFVGEEIGRQREEMKERLILDGTFVTPGRLVARHVTEPGTRAYSVASGLVDFAVNILADPAVYAAAGLSKAQYAERTFRSAGLLRGIRRSVAPEQLVDEWLNVDDLGQRTVAFLTKERDLATIWDGPLRRQDIRLARQLADNTEETRTKDLLRGVLGTQIPQKPTAPFSSRMLGSLVDRDYGRLFGFGASVRRRWGNVRYLNEVPGRKLDPENIDQAARTVADFARNVGLRPEKLDGHLHAISELADGDAVGLFGVARRLMRDTEEVLVERWGVKKAEARRLTRLYDDAYEDLRAFYVDELGRNADILGAQVVVDGNLVDTRAVPHLLSELIDSVIPLPDPRAIRRQASFMRRVWGIPGVSGSVSLLEATMSQVWKPLQLLRPAYLVRVQGENQLRIAGAGYDSVFRHPWDYMQWVIARRGARTLEGEALDEVTEFAAAMHRGSAGWRDLPGEVLTGRYPRIRKGHPEYFRGAAVELQHMASDPVMRRVAGGLSEADLASLPAEARSLTGLELVQEWWWRGTGQAFRRRLARMEGKEELATDPSAARAYLQTYLDRLNLKTGQHPELIEAVAKGKLGKVKVLKEGAERKLAQALEGYEEVLPAWVKVPESVVVPERGQALTRAMDRGAEAGFSLLMTRPENFLARSVVWRQAYWRRLEDLLPYMTRQTQEAVIRRAKEEAMGRSTLRRMASVVLRGPGERIENFQEASRLSKAFALDEVRDLLYDLTRRNQTLDAMRLVLPFGQAWKEIITAWSGIVSRRPQVIRRLQQAVTSARGEELGELAGNYAGEGFFYTDPSTLEETFIYPGSGLVSKFLLGTRDPRFFFTGRVAGLNLFSATILPGFGPVVQVPAGVLIPDTPRYDYLREIVLPFGSEAPLEAFLPAWAEKLRVGLFDDPDGHRLYANTVMDVARALVSSGDYSTRSAQEIDRLLRDSKRKARYLWLIRGLAQSTLPTGPSLEWTTRDLENNLVPVKLLAADYRKMLEQFQGDEAAAFSEFLRKFGVDNVLALQPKSRRLAERAVTELGADWERAHPDQVKKYPLVVGLFAPEEPAGQFDYNAYVRLFAEGAREQLTAGEMLALSNQFLGRVAYEQARRLMGDRSDAESGLFLAAVRDQLAQEYPGYNSYIPVTPRPQTEDLVGELELAVQDPALRETDVGRAIILYLQARDRAMARAQQELGLRHFDRAKAAAPLRFWLADVAEAIMAQHPDFSRAWEGVFRWEVEGDETVVGAGV
jgi:hypothetical protein